jgi:hypothetical protein
MTIMTELTATTMTLLMSEDGVVTGNEIVITSIEGLESTNMRRDSTSRLMSDGDYTEQGTKGGKVVTIEGDAVFDTRREAKEFVMDLLAFLADGGVGKVIVIDEDLELTRTTYVELNTLDEPVINGTSVSFAYDLYAADPAKYGDPVEFAAPSILIPGLPTSFETMPKNRVRVFNRTSAPGYVFMKATSAFASPIVTELSSMFAVATPGLSVSAGESIEYNALDKTVVKVAANGTRTSHFGADPENFFAAIPAGQSRVFEVTNDQMTADSGANNVAVEFTIVGDGDFMDSYVATFNAINGNPDRQVVAGYAPNGQMAGWLEAFNEGTAPVEPVFEVRGNYPDGVAILDLETSRRIGISGAVNATPAQPLKINVRTGKAYLGAANITSRLTYRQWTKIKGRSNAVFELDYSSAGTTKQELKVGFEPKWH